MPTPSRLIKQKRIALVGAQISASQPEPACSARSRRAFDSHRRARPRHEPRGNWRGSGRHTGCRAACPSESSLSAMRSASGSSRSPSSAPSAYSMLTSCIRLSSGVSPRIGRGSSNRSLTRRQPRDRRQQPILGQHRERTRVFGQEKAAGCLGRARAVDSSAAAARRAREGSIVSAPRPVSQRPPCRTA